MDQVIIAVYRPESDRGSCACGFHTRLTQTSDLVSLTFWSSIQLAGSAETCASANGQQKGSTSDVGDIGVHLELKVTKLGTGYAIGLLQKWQK